MWNLPPGFMSAMCGTWAAMRLKSSRSSATPASLAIASRCSTAFVEPPSAEVTRDRVLERLLGHDLARRDAEPQHVRRPPRRRAGRRPRGGRRSPAATPCRAALMPIASAIELIVLAVNIPPHAPSPGQALRSISASSSSVIVPSGARADGLEHARDVERHAVVLARA